MTYVLLMLLAVALGIWFGSAPSRGWPWRRKNPVRSTLSIALPLLAIAVVVSSAFFRWGHNPLVMLGVYAAIAPALAAAVWLAPNRRWYEPLMYLFLFGILIYQCYRLYR